MILNVNLEVSKDYRVNHKSAYGLSNLCVSGRDSASRNDAAAELQSS